MEQQQFQELDFKKSIVKKIKVIVFDSWTVGVMHFHRLEEEFRNRGFEFLFVHVGTWGSDLDRPKEEMIGNIVVRDISFYPTKSLQGILDYEKPNVVIFLSIQTFIHRAFNRYCLKRGVKTIHMYHGLINIYPETGFEIVNKKAYRLFVLSKIGKIISTVFPVYATSLLKTGGTWGDWKRFITDTYKMAVGIKNTNGSNDSLTTKCAVFTEADVSHAVNYYGFSPIDVTVIGNPDLIRFGVGSNELLSWSDNAVNSRKIVYIDTGSIELGLFFNDGQDFVNHLINTSEHLKKNGYEMQVKLKPGASYGIDNADLLKIMSENGIDIIGNDTFHQALMNASGCIVETTTLALVPALLGLPLLLAKYNKLSSLGFGSVLTSYPKARFLYDLSKVSALLKEINETDDAVAMNLWVDNNSGPMPPDFIDKRVADLIQKLA